jgi:predicted dehydrogenase
VLVEKPMGMNTGECVEMIGAADKAGVLLGVAQIFRFTHSLNRIRALLQSGEIGDPIFARSEFSYQGLAAVRKWIADPAIAGGGPIMDIGVHCADSLRFILGQEVKAIAALARYDEHWRNVEAAAVLNLQFDGGTLAAVLVSARADYRSPLEIVGTRGTIRAEDALNVEHPLTIELLRGGKVVHSEELSNTDAYAQQVDAFALAVKGQQPFRATGDDGLRNQLVLDAAYRSIRGGHTETIL